MKITFKDLEDANCASVTDYCRLLVSENKKDYSDEKILVYRDSMLCLTVNDIYATAKLDVLENKNEGPKFVKWKDKTMSEETKARLALNRPAKGVRADRTLI
jgi:hypothetical protein